MGRYFIENETIKSSAFAKAHEKAGLSIPEGIDPKFFFMLKCWLWSNEDQDFTLEKLDENSVKAFNSFQDANEFFQQARYHDFQKCDGHEIRLEMIRFKYGEGKIIQSRILFPEKTH